MLNVALQNECFSLNKKTLRAMIEAVAALIERKALTSDELAWIMTHYTGHSSASGAWNWRQAYDIMQAGASLFLLNSKKQPDPVMLDAFSKSLLTETRRSEGQIILQQFSTPLPYAHLVARVAGITHTDLVFEPSAGTGSLAGMARQFGAKLMLNELDPFRANLIAALFNIRVTQHDAEHIDDLLGTAPAPSVIVMNPPFASSQDRSRDKHMAAKHIIGAAKRLQNGGRLVCIAPRGFNQVSDPSYWARLSKIVTCRISMTVPGSLYRKMGTNVDTLLYVFDKSPDIKASHRTIHIETIDRALHAIDDLLPRRLALTEIKTKPASHTTPLAKKPNMPDGLSSKATGVVRPSKQKTRPNALVPLNFKSLDTPKSNKPISAIYAQYTPQRIEIDSACPHPTPLVESIAMASVAPPIPNACIRDEMKLPRRLIEDGVLSDAQLETIIMANDAHARNMPGRFTINDDQTQMLRKDDDETAQPYRLGYFLGDGTGCGKGRECAGLIMLNWLAGRRRAVWISKSATLIEDAIRDWSDLGGAPTDIQTLSKWKSDEDISMHEGILFVTYATLRSAGKHGDTRLDQILNWLGRDFDGIIGFDEAHAMQNAAGSEEGRGAMPSQQGLAGLRLQLALPRSRVFYISATGATTVHNLAYAVRLGLWGQGVEYPFPSRQAFVSAMEAGGVAAMEVVARDLKTLGFYTARALSFEGVEYDVLEHKLSQAQIKIYDAYAGAFKTIHQNLSDALEATGIVSSDGKTNASASKAAARSRFESTKQRFFNALLMGMKAPSIINAIRRDVADGFACVVQIVSTGESLLKRRLGAMDPEDELVEGALTPRDYVVGYLENAFPIYANKLVEIDGNMVAEPLLDEFGRKVVSREALALRDTAIEELMLLAPIPAALDQIIWALGEDSVSEVTGRSIRPLKTQHNTIYIEKRAASSNSSETAAFMDGEKNVLIFSDAGGTGRSYHAAQSAKNQRRRRHYLVEPGWRADAAIQGLGRTHRSAQVSAPFFRICTSDVHGEKRFTSTISKRMDTLGALSKGQRETGSQGMFRDEDNLESPIARAALRGYYADLAHGRASAMRYETFIEWTALSLTDQDGILLEELPPIQRFLNRILALPIYMQNAIFEEFMARIADQTERARQNGTLDLGIETLTGDQITVTSEDDLWTCPNSGAVTRIIGLSVTNPVHIINAEQALQLARVRKPMINRASGRVGLIDKSAMQFYDEDKVTLLRKVVRPNGTSHIEEEAFQRSAWETIAKDDFKVLWDTEANEVPHTKTETLFLLTGLLLPIWKDIPTNNERIYRVTPDNNKAMIGRTLGEDGAAALRARFITGAPKSSKEMIDVALNTTSPVDLGRGLILQRRRVAGETRLEITGVDAESLTGFKALGCFTEIIAFQLRLFVPHGDGINSAAVVAKIVGEDKIQIAA